MVTKIHKQGTIQNLMIERKAINEKVGFFSK